MSLKISASTAPSSAAATIPTAATRASSTPERRRRRRRLDGKLLGFDPETGLAGHAAQPAASAPTCSSARPRDDEKPKRSSHPEGHRRSDDRPREGAAAAVAAARGRRAPGNRQADHGRPRPLRPVHPARRHLRQPRVRRGGVHDRPQPRRDAARREARRRRQGALRSAAQPDRPEGSRRASRPKAARSRCSTAATAPYVSHDKVNATVPKGDGARGSDAWTRQSRCSPSASPRAAARSRRAKAKRGQAESEKPPRRSGRRTRRLTKADKLGQPAKPRRQAAQGGAAKGKVVAKGAKKLALNLKMKSRAGGAANKATQTPPHNRQWRLAEQGADPRVSQDGARQSRKARNRARLRRHRRRAHRAEAPARRDGRRGRARWRQKGPAREGQAARRRRARSHRPRQRRRPLGEALGLGQPTTAADRSSVCYRRRTRASTATSASATACWPSSRTAASDGAGYRGDAIKKLPREKRRLLGIYRAGRRGGGTIEPIDRKELKSWPILPGDEGDGARTATSCASNWSAAAVSRRRGRECSKASAIPSDQRKISLIAIHAHGIPEDFPESVIEECEDLEPPTMAGRTDLRDTAAPHHRSARRARPRRRRVCRSRRQCRQQRRHGSSIVAIADVAHYIRPGTQARSRSAAARQLGLFPRPRRADAAGENLKRPLFAARRRGAALPRGAHGLRSARRKEAATRSCAP